jgi:hypothetical protein
MPELELTIQKIIYKTCEIDMVNTAWRVLCPLSPYIPFRITCSYIAIQGKTTKCTCVEIGQYGGNMNVTSVIQIYNTSVSISFVS